MATGGINLSREFFELIKAIGESKSKQEEDSIILREVSSLKHKLETPRSNTPPVGGVAAAPQGNAIFTSKKRSREFLVRLLYVEMMGHDASFGYIKAVEMAASASLYHKRTGYLVCKTCLSPDHEFRFMLVNQMQRDLQSSNVLEICGGLLAAASLITSDMVPAVAGEATKLLTHGSESVRKKAILAMHRFCQLAPEIVSTDEVLQKVRVVLCDRDPAVMGSSLNVIENLALVNPQPMKELIPSLVSILKQIGEHRLPTDFDYHRVPAPWMQMKLIRILGILGRGDAAASSGMYELIGEAMKKADVGINAGYAIVYECIKTIISIYPNPTLLDAAGAAISRFIQSRSHNLKYLGVTGLSLIVESHPQYAAQHQIAVMDCLEDPDETLQRKTLDLLYRMTNPVNVEFITEKLLEFLQYHPTDVFLQQVLTKRICIIAERYAPNNAWYIATITKLFEVCGDLVEPSVAQNLMSLIAEGSSGGESEEEDMLLRQNAIEIYVNLLMGDKGNDQPTATGNKKAPAQLPRILLETMAWCLGEYAYLSAQSDLQTILQELCNIAKQHKAILMPSTRHVLVAAIMKLVAQAGTCPSHAAGVIDEYAKSNDVSLQQRCLEFQTLLTTAPQLLSEVLPVDASAEDVQVDQQLSCLNDFVQHAIANGAKPYDKPIDEDDDDDYVPQKHAATEGKFKMTPYEKPTKPSSMGGIRGMGSDSRPGGVALPPGANQGPAASAAAPAAVDGLALNTRNVANVWGKGGLSASAPAAPAAPGFGAPSAPSSYSTSGFGAPAAAAAAAPPPASSQQPEKTREQLEKERMAAALFGGIVPGAAPPPAAAPPVPAPAPPPAPAPTPPPAPAPEVDLLDLMGFDDGPAAPAPAAPAAPAPVDDIWGAPAPSLEPVPAGQPAAAEPPQVETVADDDEEKVAAAPAPAVMEDPFAAEGLLGGLTDKPLSMSVPSTTPSVFEFQGTPLQPCHTMTTPQFGQQWSACTASSPVSVTSTKITSLDAFMSLCEQVGAHRIEAIAATNEGIAAGMVSLPLGVKMALIHGKITPQVGGSAKLDVTVRSSDGSMSSTLALYIQTMMR